MAVAWGRKTIKFAVAKEDRSTLRITVAPDSSVMVRVPARATDAEIAERVRRRAGWIDAQQHDFSLWKPRTPPRSYVSGESHKYLGRSLRLHVRGSLRNAVTVTQSRLVMETLGEKSRGERADLLWRWYTSKAQTHFRRRLAVQHKLFARVLPTPPTLIARRMTNRWGSYTKRGNLVLNVELIQVSTRLLDYVITHELAHAAYWGHGKDWQALMTTVMPDWRERKAALEKALL
ncbi:MAG: M48 family metallopeptidase [Hyphomonadaceae bacterium]|nr:M48 family metallopeptidase [Hyphomonadaceae bacterium]